MDFRLRQRASKVCTIPKGGFAKAQSAATKQTIADGDSGSVMHSAIADGNSSAAQVLP